MYCCGALKPDEGLVCEGNFEECMLGIEQLGTVAAGWLLQCEAGAQIFFAFDMLLRNAVFGPFARITGLCVACWHVSSGLVSGTCQRTV